MVEAFRQGALELNQNMIGNEELILVEGVSLIKKIKYPKKVPRELLFVHDYSFLKNLIWHWANLFLPNYVFLQIYHL